MSSGKERPAPKRATMAIRRGLPPVRISRDRMVSGGGHLPATASHSTAHSLVLSGRSSSIRNRSYKAWSGLSISSNRLVALASRMIRGSVWRILRNCQPASGSAMSLNIMFRFSTISTSRFPSRSEKSSRAPRQRSARIWSS